MKVLIITNLFPNSKEPTRGIYNKQEFLELAKLCEIKVVAPLPWYYKREVPKREDIDGIDVYHLRYFMMPKIARSLYGFFFFLSLVEKVKKIYENFKFDLIFAAWVYPDGFGSFLIAKALRTSIVIKVQGSDVNRHTKYYIRRKMISYTLRNSKKVIAVSKALKERMIEISVPEDKIIVISNGVDTSLFKPMDKEECRKKMGLPLNKKIILFIGNLVPVKGVDFLVEAFYKVSDTIKDLILVIVGDGHKKQTLWEKTKKLGLEKRINFVSKQSHNTIPLWINSCDVFCLPSLSEGCPNVILEAIACGKPIVASNVGGIPELLESNGNTILVTPGNSDELANAISNILGKRQLSGENTHRNFNIDYSWSQVARKTFDVINSSIQQ